MLVTIMLACVCATLVNGGVVEDESEATFFEVQFILIHQFCFL